MNGTTSKPRHVDDAELPAAQTLITLGYIILAVGVLGAIGVFLAMGTIESEYGSSSMNPVGIGLAIGVFVQSLIIVALMHGLASIVNDVRTSRDLLREMLRNR